MAKVRAGIGRGRLLAVGASTVMGAGAGSGSSNKPESELFLKVGHLIYKVIEPYSRNFV